MRRLGLALALLIASEARATDYYASPTGSGSACSLASPCSLATVQTTVQAAIAGGMTEDARVRLRAGTYTLTSGLTFGAADSGRNGHYVTWTGYPGEAVVISGGQALTGWAGSGNFYAAADWTFRQIYVNGTHATRARGALSPAGWTKVAGVGGGYTMPSNAMASYGNKTDIEIVKVGQWSQSRCHPATIVDVDMVMEATCWANEAGVVAQGYGIEDTPYFVENAYELLDASEEWYLDDPADTVYYRPTSGSMTGLTVIAPKVENLITLDGASYLRFNNLQFAHTDWTAPSSAPGYVAIQGGVYWTTYNTAWATPPAGFVVDDSDYIELASNTFTHMGARGLLVKGGSSYVTITENMFSDSAGGGLQVGDISQGAGTGAEECDATESHITVRGNYFPAGATFDYTDAGRIFAPCISDSVITQNHIRTAIGAPITLGWGWSGSVSAAHNNTVSLNYIKGYCIGYPDCGAIYLNSIQSATTSYATGAAITSNYMEAESCPYSTRCMMFDNGVAWATATRNVCIFPTNWYFGNSVDGDHCLLTGNYPDTATYAGDGTLSGNTVITSSSTQNYGTVQQDVICSAGVPYGSTPGASGSGATQLRPNCTARLKESAWPTWGAIDTSGLVAYFPLNENARPVAYNHVGGTSGLWSGASAATNGSYAAGMTSADVAGNFNGTTDYIDLANPAAPLIPATGPWTLGMWVNVDPAAPGYANFWAQLILAANIGRMSFKALGSNPYQVYLELGAIGAHPAVDLISVATWPASEWHHVAAMRSGATFTTFLDGVAVATQVDADATRAILQTGNIIGAQSGNGSSYLPPLYFGKTKISDVVVYSRALTSAEITALYNAGR